MASSSKRWAKSISRKASFVFFLLILLQIPLFRIPCRLGICKSPLQVTSSQLIACQYVPQAVMKVLLYPGAVGKAVYKGKPLPSYSKVLNFYRFTKGSAKTEYYYLEVLVGSYFAVAGAFLGLVGSWRLSISGILLIIWGVAKEAILGQEGIKNRSSAYMYPTMSIALRYPKQELDEACSNVNKQ
ncbi:PH domain-containing protein [Heracleum sosnowskyi]|uniref:PH domain-containing protein n=1 Tax=Heracleum sosnowskyi TaxID=360622 RepID=A0AAD8H0I9_9APIA|nr:PH domain-containing protein [Heracleum sosnowskyi]